MANFSKHTPAAGGEVGGTPRSLEMSAPSSRQGGEATQLDSSISMTTLEPSAAMAIWRTLQRPDTTKEIIHSGGESVVRLATAAQGETFIEKEFLDGNVFHPKALRGLQTYPAELLPAIGAPHARALTLTAQWLQAQLADCGIEVQPLPVLLETATTLVSRYLPRPTLEDLEYLVLGNAVSPTARQPQTLRDWQGAGQLPSTDQMRGWHQHLMDAVERSGLMTPLASHFLVQSVSAQRISLVLIDLK